MHNVTRAMLDCVAGARRCHAGGLSGEIRALLAAMNEAALQATDVGQAFEAAEEVEDNATLQPFYQYQQKYGALERELRKLREQLQALKLLQREISELDARVGAPARRGIL